jgi:hypothetical protein
MKKHDDKNSAQSSDTSKKKLRIKTSAAQTLSDHPDPQPCNGFIV